ncbi:MAG: hypothetical protein E7141_02475 [Rikenellaceae bacterium]|nr:hypothetical protein [Rikenellaceae bacterium]
MKRFLLSLVLAASLVLTSCSDPFDDSAIWETLDEYGEAIKDHEQRIAALEELCKQMNTNISSLQTIVEALQNKDYVTAVVPVVKDGITIGYTITFSKLQPVTIYHGEDGKDGADGKDGKDGYTPQIGVKQDTDGIYYWTLDGEWLLDESGNKIKAVGTDGKDGQNGEDGKDGADGSNGNDGQNGADGKDGITPQLKIEDDYWYISYDNGATWTKLGKATGEDGKDGQDGANGSGGDSFFQSVTQDEECVYLTLADGTIITLPKHKAEAANCKIYYTTPDGKKLFPNTTEPAVFGAILVSNVYEDGQGILTFDDTITSIGNHAFEGCTSLANITVPDSVTSIGEYAFKNCTSLTRVTIGNSVTSIGEFAFSDCTSLTSITIPDSVTSIGEYAFKNCTSLTSVTIGNSVTSIGEFAFSDCTSLTSITIPNSVTEIGAAAFTGCTSLIRVDIFDLSAWCKIKFLEQKSSGYFYFYTNPLERGAKLYLNGSELTDITIPSDITEIKQYAFCGCTSLTSVTIGNSVTSIGDYAFEGCTALKDVYVNITDLAAYATNNRMSTIGGNKHLLVNGVEITELVIPDSVTEIGYGAFSRCTSLTSVTISDSVTNIGVYAFRSCTSLTSITIPDSVTSIGNYAFNNCTSLKRVDITDLSAWCKISFGDYEANPLSNGAKLYLNGSELTDITIPSDITEIKAYAFRGCTSLTSITIPDSVTEIGGRAFSDCTSLKEVYCKATTPPTGGGEMCDNNASDRKIYVPAESVYAYRAATYWKDYANYIVGYDFEKGEIVNPTVKEVFLEATQIQSLLGNGYYLADGTLQDVNNEATWLKWTAGSLDFEACRVMYNDYTDSPVYNGCFQFQGNASDVAKQGFLGNATSNGEIKQVIIEAYSSYATPSFNVYYGDAKLPKDSAKVLNVVDHCVKGASAIGKDGSYDVYSFTCTFDIPAGNEFFAVRNDSKGATYIKNITIKY